MGLISEMMCKGTIQRKQLKENVTFIDASNPYRRYEKKIEQIGLVTDKQKVRSLKKEDEEKYIRSMVTNQLINIVMISHY